jgi:hypothetical protein
MLGCGYNAHINRGHPVSPAGRRKGGVFFFFPFLFLPSDSGSRVVSFPLVPAWWCFKGLEGHTLRGGLDRLSPTDGKEQRGEGKSK